MYCSQRNCTNEIYLKEGNEFSLCLKHYKEYMKKIKGDEYNDV